MKKKLSVAVLIGVLFVSGCSRGYESQKGAGDVNITLKADRYPLVKGDNTLGVIVTDPAGKAVTDATANVRFYMPPMAGMAPMEFNVQAQPKGNSYVFVANPSMEGGWKVEVAVTRPGKPAATTTFNVDAR